MLADEIGLIDQHCHGVVAADLDRPDFEALLGEGRRGTFASALGLAVRRWCAPVLGLPAHAVAEDYLARRAELGWREVSARLLRAAGVARWLVDTGFGFEDEFADLSGGEVAEIVRIETVAERVIAEKGCTAAAFDEIERSLRDGARNAAGLKSITAYRCGLDFPLRDTPPAPTALDARLTDPDALGWLVGLAARLSAELGLPLQFHTGFGDTDLRLHRADPLLLTDFLRATEHTGATVVLLHCWPFHRNAAYLAHAFPHVYLDLGLTIPHVGQRASAVLAETLELAPFDRLCYSSDGYGLAELHHLGARLWRRGMARVLAEWIADDVITPADADELVIAVAAGNAARVYPAATPRPRHGPDSPDRPLR
ncbi:amidohydrolase family protein [Nocardia sp. CDC159]|uniref:Amidohydrolase family protein n=1 Tax=Nocardia pulmonis TaxID=2951408 RepID=A0A9X2J0U5_9NOCA|nr:MULTISPECIES: amidohydrolase family protein [Nocardia]MCM6778194.1 amidohydrolase family protein [Nocardia pulmonis]MCM6791083.1 amidohydrolase family protein [Nocardia sp. CDC159]